MLDRRVEVKYRAVSQLQPYARNARTHSTKQIGQLADAIARFGFTNPILVDDGGTVIAGHGRLLAAARLGMSEVPTITVGGLSDAERRALVLADNRIAMSSGWDEEMLRAELGALRLAEFDLGLTGFTDEELAEFSAASSSPGLTDPDAVPAQAEVVATRPGDVWLLGPHRPACGDCTDPAAVAAALAGARPHLMVTDPPYGVEYDADWRNQVERANGEPIGGRAVGKVMNDDRADWTEAWNLFPGDVAYVWHAGRFASTVQASLERSRFDIRCQVIWAKPRFAISRGHYHWQHEPCWYAVRKGGKGWWSGDRSQTTLWQIAHGKSETGHSTQKPVECMRRPIENNSNPGQAVYEPFSGSGTTIIAAEMSGRVCLAVELSPAYVDLAVARWQEFTGKKATRESDGVEFDYARTQAQANRAEAGPGESWPASAQPG